MVGLSKNSAPVTAIPIFSLTEATSLTARIEFPPSSKKLSFMPTISICSTSPQSSASFLAESVFGAT